MNTRAEKTQRSWSTAAAYHFSGKQGPGEYAFGFADNRPEAVAQRRRQERANTSPQVQRLAQLQARAGESSQEPLAKLQRIADRYATAPVVQRKGAMRRVEKAEGEPGSAALTSHATGGDKGTVQLYVSKYTHGKEVWWQSSITGRLYETREAAEKAERDAVSSGTGFGSKAFDMKKRVPTMFTHMQTPMSKGIGGNMQGPHIIADVGLKKGIKDMLPKKLDKEFTDQVPAWDKVEDIVEEEKGNLVHDTEFSDKKERLKKDYQHLHQLWQLAKKSKGKKTTKMKRHLLYQGLNLHPYGTYAWNLIDPKSTEPDFDKWMKGKGERGDAPAKKLVDPNYKNKKFFANQSRLEKYHKKRLGVLEYRKSAKKRKKRK